MSTLVEVNEVKILATRLGADWWLMFMQAFANTDRIKTTQITMAGIVCTVDCDDREHAQQWMDNAIEHGVPKAALRILSGRAAA